jgi:hypothetical protein
MPELGLKSKKPHNFWTTNLFLAWYGLLESYIDSPLYKIVSENPKNYCTCRSLPKIAKTNFRVDCLLGVKKKERKIITNAMQNPMLQFPSCFKNMKLNTTTEMQGPMLQSALCLKKQIKYTSNVMQNPMHQSPLYFENNQTKHNQCNVRSYASILFVFQRANKKKKNKYKARSYTSISIVF